MNSIDGSVLESYKEIEELQNYIRHRLQTVLGIQCKVSIVEPKNAGTLPGQSQPHS